jgi:hypothetical protein
MKKEEIKTPINNNIVERLPLPTNPINKVKKEGVIKEVQNNIEVIPTKNNIIQDSSMEIEIMKKDYEIESLKLEYNRLMDEKNILTQDNFNLTSKLEEKDIKINELEEKLSIYAEKPKDLTQEAFLLHLGTLIYKRCEKSQNETEKNNCKDLYFDYIKNN